MFAADCTQAELDVGHGECYIPERSCRLQGAPAKQTAGFSAMSHVAVHCMSARAACL